MPGCEYKQFRIMQATTYEDKYGKVLAFYRDLAALVRPARFYDLGCWQGGISALMADLGVPAVAVDMDPAPLLEGYPGVEFHRDDYMGSADKYLMMIADETGPVVVLCDGGGGEEAKLEQALRYAPGLRVGDVLLTHDFGEVAESGGTTPARLYPAMAALGYDRLEMDGYDPLLMGLSMHVRVRADA